MPKILVIVPFPLDADGVDNRRAQLRTDAVGPDTEFVFRPVRVGPGIFDSWHDKTIAMLAMLEAGMNAEDEGFDAVCVDTAGDSGMSGLRSMLSIPVIGGGLASYHLALMLGDKFSVVTLWEGLDRGVPTPTSRLTMSRTGSHRCARSAISPTSPTFSLVRRARFSRGWSKLRPNASRMTGPKSSSLVPPLCTKSAEYLAEHLSVPVINPGLAAYNMAEAMLRLRISHSRKAYPSPLFPKRELLAAMVDGGAKLDQAREYARGGLQDQKV